MHGLVLGLMAVGVCFSYFVSQGLPFEFERNVAVSGLSVPGTGAMATNDPVLTSDVLPDTVRRSELEDGLNVLSGDGINTDGQESARADTGEPEAPYILYSVQEGDTASAIAARFGIELQYLLFANPDLRDGELLVVGQMLLIPAGNGLLYHLRYGETLSDLAARYGVSVEAIIGWRGNGIDTADQVVEDQLVFILGGTPPVTILPEPTTVPTQPPVFVGAPDPGPQPVSPPSAPASSGSGLIWPVYGPISSYMDGSHPLGIDIDLFNAPGAAIAAATSGTVTFAGGNACCSYGLYVVVMSPDGIETLYAHLSSISVSVGQQVGQGQTLGYAGCTGYCTGTHLHFEVYDNGVRVNPLAYLP